ncbi:alpha/beta hydrolase family protein [Nocardia sp. NPDC050712]|uniref:alpha/beta hydrolase n=1 Tax=Nocardia sp. NPDC050712 TaxID=3155518 RepID=UPI0033C10B4D
MWGGTLGRVLAGAIAAVLLPFGVSAAPATAEYNPDAFDFFVDSSMGQIKTRILRAADGNTDRVVYLLDGERAESDMNGWEEYTGIPAALAAFDVNVVLPVGGQSSFYVDWAEPSSFHGVNPDGNALPGSDSGSAVSGWAETSGKTSRYVWETFLTRTLKDALAERLGFATERNGVFGLSMGGSAALLLAAYHPDQFGYAGSLSGYLHMSAPGMREALGLAMIAAGGYNIDAMAPAGSPQWARMDPYQFAPKLLANRTRLYISAGSGQPAQQDLASADAVLQGMPLESIALANTRAFQARLTELGYTENVTYDFPAIGVHNWGNWQQVANRLVPEIAKYVGRPVPHGGSPPAPPADGQPPPGGVPPR